MRLITDQDLSSVEPVLPVRWCLERSETEELKRREAVDIHILFVIVYEDSNLEDRVCVPINEVMTYLNFRRPGNHLVLARVIWGKAMVKHCMKKSSKRDFQNKVLDDDRTGFWYGIEGRVTVSETDTELEVAIPKEHFPKEQPEWVKRIVNFGYDYPPIDQCDFRKRMLLCVPKLPFLGVWAVFTTLIRIIIVLYLGFFGIRNIGFRAVLHPWRNDIEDVVYNTDFRDNWFSRDRNYKARPLSYMLLHPMLHLGWFSTLTAVKRSLGITYLELLSRMWFGLIALFERILSAMSGILVMLVFVVIGMYLVSKLVSKLSREQKLKKETPGYKDRIERKRLESYDNLYKLLACRPGIAPAVDSLPKERQSVKLKFLKLKARVCRPYAAN